MVCIAKWGKMSAPCVLIASCSDIHPKEIVKDILGVSSLDAGEPVTETIEAYPWHIDTKYYTADIQLCTTETRTIGDRDFAELVQGFVLVFDTTDMSSFQQVRSWVPFVKELEPQVQILVCHCCKEGDRISRQQALAWCLENAFELVELEPVENCDSEDDDFRETTGIKRVIQALHAHPWPNLNMKERPAFRSSLMTQMMADEVNNRQNENESSDAEARDAGQDAEPSTAAAATAAAASSSLPDDGTASSKSAKELRNMEQQRQHRAHEPEPAGTTEAGAVGSGAQGSGSLGLGACALEPGQGAVPKASKEEKKQKNEQERQKVRADTLDAMLDDDLAMFRTLREEGETESFEELFERMRVMKERAEHLPPEERKKYAEKVAVAFWKAIGGEEEEIEGITDSDDGFDV